MDLLNLTNKATSMNLKRRLNRGKFYFLKLEFSNYVANWQNESYGHIQNFSSISLKLCLLGQIYSGTWDVNTTLTVRA